MHLTEVEARQLSRILFEAREQLEMWADVRKLIREVDEFRAAQGWSPDGFGDETETGSDPTQGRDSIPVPTETP
jgi:hypothetical protein